jgi:WxcM-like, C-terminal
VPEPALSHSPSYSDERGTLIVTELDDVPFSVRRIFTVRGPRGGAVRGNHAVAGAQLLVLLSGSAIIQNGSDAHRLGDGIELTEPGSRILLTHGSYVRYVLPSEESTILVLCELPFVARA